MVLVDALPAGDGHADALNIRSLEGARILTTGSRERLVIAQGPYQVQLDVRHGTFAQGPVHLRYALEGFQDLAYQLSTLRRLVAVRQLSRFPRRLFAASPQAGRWILTLRVLDAVGAGASYREIAQVFFGKDRVASDWRGRSDYQRARIQRLVRSGHALRAGGYRRLLRGSPDQ